MVKAIFWRFAATANSYIILELLNKKSSNLKLAIVMNITGLVIFYSYERIWNKIKWGKHEI
jgi:uncharacterized membrane protein